MTLVTTFWRRGPKWQHYGHLAKFDGKADDWEIFTEQLSHCLAANGITDEAKKRSILLSACGTPTYKLHGQDAGSPCRRDGQNVRRDHGAGPEPLPTEAFSDYAQVPIQYVRSPPGRKHHHLHRETPRPGVTLRVRRSHGRARTRPPRVWHHR